MRCPFSVIPWENFPKPRWRCFETADTRRSFGALPIGIGSQTISPIRRPVCSSCVISCMGAPSICSMRSVGQTAIFWAISSTAPETRGIPSGHFLFLKTKPLWAGDFLQPQKEKQSNFALLLYVYKTNYTIFIVF